MHLDRASQSAARNHYPIEPAYEDEGDYFAPDKDCTCDHDDPEHNTYCACCERL